MRMAVMQLFVPLPGIAILVATVAPGFGQSAGSTRVASVKPNTGVSALARFDVPPQGAIAVTNHTAMTLVYYAYDLKSRHQLGDYPRWLDTVRFDVRALPPPNAARDRIPEMMQALLVDRFALRARWETRDQRVDALVPARQDGRLGADLKPSKHDCAAFLKSGGKALDDRAPLFDDGRPVCMRGMIPAAGIGGISAPLGGATMDELATWLERYGTLDRPVVDATGLNGTFDIRLQFSPSVAVASTDRSARWRAPPIETAVREQLGLRLEARTVPRQVLVIDSIERPGPD
jgi:uncharacterized protein (TIGR03435 family)